MILLKKPKKFMEINMIIPRLNIQQQMRKSA